VSSIQYRYVLTRFTGVVLGSFAIIWSLSALPSRLQDTRIESIGNRVLRSEPFKTDALAGMLREVEMHGGECRPLVVQSEVIIRLRLLEDALDSGRRGEIASETLALKEQLSRALGCSPADSFLWLALFWIEVNQGGYQTEQLNLLRRSYLLGPNEGWIALKRNRFALSVFEKLPSDLRELVQSEFAKLVDTPHPSVLQEMISILTGPGWRVRSFLLPRLKELSAASRQTFADALYRRGYDVDIPGTDRRDRRPWHNL
jgi:hypothetical protein